VCVCVCVCVCVGAGRFGSQFTERWIAGRQWSCEKTHERECRYTGRRLLQVQHGFQVRLAPVLLFTTFHTLCLVQNSHLGNATDTYKTLMCTKSCEFLREYMCGLSC